MLDTATKRRIDTARDILVGKVPDPKSQVEQITIALIYKFMDDMDAESEEFGGKRKFFAGEFARYGWAKLMRSGLGGHETRDLYEEALKRMPENGNLPALFRKILEDASLPYRDPETLRAFLKIIDEFNYDHSERLGDAFEYLLSVLGSQGDAGQFRTPRHIIDFMVEIIAPKKTETVLDPACGTAGFLISSYKHILKANSSPSPLAGEGRGEGATQRTGDLLTPDEKGRLAQNFAGYDISPDMVRLSLVNLYLHGFADPHIFEYDTLTSQDRWNEYADVILANPPFMSPKGGIKPHNRFSVQSKRSEVLFVDYMAEHLKAGGRAGIIVPEGIIFQSQNAYKQLRKMLVENSLVAVVSLPAGVFNPYSGVKTSILILDKTLARKTNTIAFFKVENDGFGLGAQRREIDKNDLPQAHAEIGEYLHRLRAGMSVEDLQPTLGLIVKKEKIATNGEYNLSAERHRQVGADTSHWPMVTLGTVVEIESGSRQKGGAIESGIPSIGGEQIDEKGNIRFNKMKYISEEHFRGMTKGVLRSDDVLIVKDGATTGKTGFFIHDMPSAVNEHVFILRAKEAIHPYYLYCVVRAEAFQDKLRPFIKGIIGGISLEFSGITIPLAPLKVQKEIAAEIEGYQKVINGARAVLDNYRPHIPIHPDWPMVELEEITKPEYGFTEKAAEQGDARFIRITDISEDGMLRAEDPKFITLTKEARESLLMNGDILVARTGATYGKTMIFEEGYPAVFASFLIRLRFPKDRVHPRYYWVFAQSDLYWNQANTLMTGGGQPQFNGNALKQVKIPLPPLATQQAIVAEIEAEQALVAANRELIARFEKKIQTTLSRVWGEAV
jgi:type I restriction enzyme M protein